MNFEKAVRIPGERIGALIGRSGRVKSDIEKACSVSLDVDGETGEVTITGRADAMEPFKAIELVTAIGRGFSPERAMDLLRPDHSLYVGDLREFGKSKTQLERIKGRLIGDGGKARRNMEVLSGTSISVYGKTVSVIGAPKGIRLAVDAITRLCTGSMHGAVYGRLEAARRREKLERLKLWEDNAA